MADVRELLRNELASRFNPNTGKKRKRAAELEPMRKHTKQNKENKPLIENVSLLNDTLEEPSNIDTHLSATVQRDIDTDETAETHSTALNSNQKVDEDEWAAFEREVARPSRLQPAITTPRDLSGQQVTISAAPVTAAELESRERLDREAAAKTREAALLGEREDATRFLEEEFDEMEELDRRVQRLKTMRDKLRQKREEHKRTLGNADSGLTNDEHGTFDEAEADDEDGTAGEGWDDWGFS